MGAHHTRPLVLGPNPPVRRPEEQPFPNTLLRDYHGATFIAGLPTKGTIPAAAEAVISARYALGLAAGGPPASDRVILDSYSTLARRLGPIVPHNFAGPYPPAAFIGRWLTPGDPAYRQPCVFWWTSIAGLDGNLALRGRGVVRGHWLPAPYTMPFAAPFIRVLFGLVYQGWFRLYVRILSARADHTGIIRILLIIILIHCNSNSRALAFCMSMHMRAHVQVAGHMGGVFGIPPAVLPPYVMLESLRDACFINQLPVARNGGQMSTIAAVNKFWTYCPQRFWFLGGPRAVPVMLGLHPADGAALEGACCLRHWFVIERVFTCKNVCPLTTQETWCSWGTCMRVMKNGWHRTFLISPTSPASVT